VQILWCARDEGMALHVSVSHRKLVPHSPEMWQASGPRLGQQAGSLCPLPWPVSPFSARVLVQSHSTKKQGVQFGSLCLYWGLGRMGYDS
jgi:hypothetical protein